jgi:predicted hydrocarbon binding protein
VADTKAYFPNREEAERFARQFDGERYRIAIQLHPRQDKEVFQVHVQRLEPPPAPPAGDILRMLGTVGDRAPAAGLDGEVLARRMGATLGESLALKEAPGRTERREALAKLERLLATCGLGTLGVVSVTPLVLRVSAPPQPAMTRGRRCSHVAGFMEGALGAMLGTKPAIREMDCVGLGNAYCTFSCDL